MDNVEQWLEKQLAVLCDEESDIDRREFTAHLYQELTALGPERSAPLLRSKLSHPHAAARCVSANLLLRIEGEKALRAVLPLLQDEELGVRCYAIERISEFRQEWLLDPLTDCLQHDAAPAVRGTAAHALGLLGFAQAIPALIEAMETDHEVDALGYTPGFRARGALDNLAGTNHTRIKVSEGICKMAPWPADLNALKREAQKVYERWLSSQGADSGGAPDQQPG